MNRKSLNGTLKCTSVTKCIMITTIFVGTNHLKEMLKLQRGIQNEETECGV